MRMQLQYAQSATVPIYMAEVIGHDNDLFERQILERGDVQSRSTNVKGDMTEWMVREPEWYNLCADIIQNHIIFLSGEISECPKIKLDLILYFLIKYLLRFKIDLICKLLKFVYL